MFKSEDFTKKKKLNFYYAGKNSTTQYVPGREEGKGDL